MIGIRQTMKNTPTWVIGGLSVSAATASICMDVPVEIQLLLAFIGAVYAGWFVVRIWR